MVNDHKKNKTTFKELPSDWSEISIGEKINLLTGYPFPSSKYSTSGVKLLRGSNVKRGNTDWSEEITQYWKAITPDIQDYLLRENDIVVAMDGSLVGKSFAKITKEDLPVLLLQRVARIRSDEIEPSFLKEFVCSDYFTKHCEAVKTVSAIPHISPSDIKSFRIPLPPTKTEQTAIAIALSDMDSLISNLEKLIEKKRMIKQGVMQELMTGNSRLPGYTGKWSVKKIVELADCLDNLRIPLNESERNSMQGDYPYCGANGILDYIDKFLIDDDIILMAEDGGYFDEYNYRPIAYRMRGKCWVNNHAHILKAKANISQSFLFYSIVHKNILSFLASGTRAKLNKSEMFKIEICLPDDFEEQNEIASIISNIDEEIATLQINLIKYNNVKQGMMQTLLTGKIRLV